ncbi:ArsR family transcriptional regulator [Echinicola soli]|uniref:HTH-type transcriptional regulator n=1 Tax=Echinicola soli TaxID=2591634 RepID=A0A514CJJ3_9BACT|nr:MarR family transcriptional regulator [Echinicola soli]QDH79985.1 ArsR family transcriptional regulator [Echinicola soli]
MNYEEAKQKYIQAWGTLGSSWGINRTMGQIHALMMVSTEPLSTDQIMEELKISRGNANMNIRALMDWGLVEKVLVPGDRKEYFSSEKDVMSLAVQVAKERKRRELEPILKVLNEVKGVKEDTMEAREFKAVTTDLLGFARQSETVLDMFINSKKNWFFRLVTKIKG